MAQYETPVTIPDSVAGFFERFQEQGEIRFNPGDRKAVFAFEADDLWDAAQILGDIKTAVNADLPMMGEYVDFDKPTRKNTPRAQTEGEQTGEAEKPKRKRRTRAEMEAARAAEAEKTSQPSTPEPEAPTEPDTVPEPAQPTDPNAGEASDEPSADELDALLN